MWAGRQDAPPLSLLPGGRRDGKAALRLENTVLTLAGLSEDSAGRAAACPGRWPRRGAGPRLHRAGSSACSRPSGLNEDGWVAKGSQTRYEAERWRRAERVPAGRWGWDARLRTPGPGALCSCPPQPWPASAWPRLLPTPSVDGSVRQSSGPCVLCPHFSERLLLESKRTRFILSWGSVSRPALCH